MVYIVLSYLPSILAGIHAVRTGRAQTWLFIVVIAPILGPAIYFFSEIVPELLGGPTARKVGKAARQSLDPEREYRDASRAVEDSPTLANLIRMAQAAAGRGRWQEAEGIWRSCSYDHGAEDPVVLLGHANSLLELGEFKEALGKLEKLKDLGREGESGPAALAFARAYEGLGRLEEAESPFRFAADNVPGLEAGARYVAYLARAGRDYDAKIGLGEIERRYARISPSLRKDAKPWRDLASRAVRGA